MRQPKVIIGNGDAALEWMAEVGKPPIFVDVALCREFFEYFL
jgi:hypothetical protein